MVANLDAGQRIIAVATQNAGKVKEISANISLENTRFVSLAELGINTAPVEDASDYLGNAQIKASAALDALSTFRLNLIGVIADDSGLEVEALCGAPGIHSARYAVGADAALDSDSHDDGGFDNQAKDVPVAQKNQDQQNIDKLLCDLWDADSQNRRARFVCTMLFMAVDGTQISSFGSCSGVIADAPKGEFGFGYDPIFLPEDYHGRATMAELSPEQKDIISHRGRALGSLKTKLSQYFADAGLAQNEQNAKVTNLVSFDFDDTILEGHSPVLAVTHLVLKGVLPFTVAIKTIFWALRYKLHMPVEQAQVRKYIFDGFSNYPCAQADEILIKYYKEFLTARFRPKALKAIQEHKERGDKVVIVSASFAPIIVAAAKDLGACWAISTQMEIKDGYYTGNVMLAPPEGEQKVIQLKEWADKTFGKCGWQLVAAYGDHRSDAELLGAAKRPVAVTPDSGLTKLAKKQGWEILDWSFKPNKT